MIDVVGIVLFLSLVCAGINRINDPSSKGSRLPVIIVPARGSDPVLGFEVKIDAPNYRGSGLKNYFKDQLSKNPLFFQPVQINPPIEKLQVHTIGEWIFGTPHYEGNVRFQPDQGNITILVPSDAPKEVMSLLQSVFPNESIVSDRFGHSPKILKESELDEEYLLSGRKCDPVTLNE